MQLIGNQRNEGRTRTIVRKTRPSVQRSGSPQKITILFSWGRPANSTGHPLFAGAPFLIHYPSRKPHHFYSFRCGYTSISDILISMKLCPRCLENKTDEGFYVREGKLSSYCRDCAKSYSTEWTRLNRERKIENNRKWTSRNLDRKRIMNAASNALYRAIKHGEVKRPCRCSLCERVCKPEASHADYSKPLEVVWMCRSCHRTLNAKYPMTAL